MKITLARALKEKNILAGEITKLFTRLKLSNSFNSRNKPTYDCKELLPQITKKQEQLIELKLLISKATDPVREIVLSMAEIKTTIANLKAVNIQSGEVNPGYAKEPVIMTAQISEAERDNLVDQYEEQINKFQDQLDKHNATTEIEWNK